MSDKELVLLGCGDVGPIHEPIAGYSALVTPTLSAADIVFGQCERTYSERGALQVHSGGGHSRCKPAMASVFSDCGFDVLSLASNHAMDWGEHALLDTIDLFRDKGILTVGAGRNLEEARRPAIIEHDGIKVGFLAYCSVLRDGYAAQTNKAGVAPLRVHTYYEAFDYQPGVPPKVVTIPFEEDLAAMESDIAVLRKSVDTLVVSMHWGVHYIPRMIADYQPLAAQAAFAAGADLILGHHAHTPKAIGVYDRKVCLYSLSNFIMSGTEKSPTAAPIFEQRYGVKLDPDYPRLSYGSDAKRSLIAKAVLGRAGVKRVSFLPVLIDKQLRPEILLNGDSRFHEALRFMDWVSEGFAHQFTIEGNEIVINPH